MQTSHPPKHEALRHCMMCFEEKLAVLILNRPKALNALNSEMLEDIQEAVEKIEAQREIATLIITGAGEKAFVAGADITEMAKLSKQEGYRFSRRGQQLFTRIEKSRLFSIAAINGFALGGGLELAMACSMRVMAHDAKVGLPEVSLGIIPGYGGTSRLTNLVGAGHASELIATGRKVDSHYAWRIGLVNHVVPKESLLETCKGIASEVAGNAPLAVAAALDCIRTSQVESEEAASRMEALEFSRLVVSKDAREGVGAFVQKRKPEFRGE